MTCRTDEEAVEFVARSLYAAFMDLQPDDEGWEDVEPEVRILFRQRAYEALFDVTAEYVLG